VGARLLYSLAVPRTPVVKRASRPFSVRLRSSIFFLPAMLSPISAMRVAFHRLRGVRVSRTAEIGYLVIIDNLYPEKVIIEDDATVAARTTILSHDESKAYSGRGPERVVETRVGRGAFVGVHCVILPGVTIGARAIVGAGSVVTEDVPEGATVVGVPARMIPTGSLGTRRGE